MSVYNFKFSLILFTLFHLSVRPEIIDYCDNQFDCEGPEEDIKHSICMTKCIRSTRITILRANFAFRQHILHWHNYYRNYLASGKEKRGGNSAASNMMVLNYDYELELTAACWIYHTDILLRDPCRRTTKFNKVGQNIWNGSKIAFVTSEGVKTVISDFYEQVQLTDESVINGYKRRVGRKFLNFAQLEWALTTHVGCAICIIRTQPRQYVLACNYGPGGLKLADPVYIKGDPTTNCPNEMKPNKEWPSLCGKTEPWTKEAQFIGNPGFREMYRHMTKPNETTNGSNKLISRNIMIIFSLIHVLFHFNTYN